MTSNKVNSVLKNTITLSSNVKVYVPSTVEVDVSTDNSEMVRHVATLMGGWFGGATAHDAIGTWVSNDGSLVYEKVTIVESFCTSDGLSDHIIDVLELAEYIKAEMSQEAVSIEVNNILHLV